MGTETMTPADATHVGPGGQVYKYTGAGCWIWQGNLWSLIRDLPAQAVQIKREWNGEGLPPVGTVCEVQNDVTGGWDRVNEVIAHTLINGTMVAVFKHNDRLSYSPGTTFRPIPTPEQIAAEERKNGIRAMMDAIGFSRTVLSNKDCEILWDAGYRPTHS